MAVAPTVSKELALKIEKYACLFSVVGFSMRYLQIAGGQFLLVLSLSSLAVLYSIFGQILFSREEKNEYIIEEPQPLGVMQKFLLQVSKYASGILVLSMLFGFFFWPMGALFSMLGISGGLFCIVLSVFLFQNERSIRRNIFTRIALLILIVALISFSSRESKLKFFYRDPAHRDHIRTLIEQRNDDRYEGGLEKNTPASGDTLSNPSAQ